MKTIVRFFDKLEDHVRGGLSHYPLLYSLIGGVGVVLFWRGVWHTADLLETNTGWGSVLFSGIGSMLVGIVVLLMIGLFVSVFIGDSIIMSGIRHDKKLIEKSEDEIEDDLTKEKRALERIGDEIEKIEAKL